MWLIISPGLVQLYGARLSDDVCPKAPNQGLLLVNERPLKEVRIYKISPPVSATSTRGGQPYLSLDLSYGAC